jgi:FMN-dependent NADH-azoreductase
MTLFRLDASINPAGSKSREIADIVEQEWLAARPGDTIERRHIGTEPIPATAWAAAVSAGWTPADQLTGEQIEAKALAKTLTDELLAADGILFAIPLYNFGVSQHIKTYIDLVQTSPDFKHAGEFLKGRKVVLVTVRGGNYSEGTPRHGWDHSTPYLRRIFADSWGADLTVVEREFTLVGVDPNLDQFKDMAAALHATALDAAREAGKALSV